MLPFLSREISSFCIFSHIHTLMVLPLFPCRAMTATGAGIWLQDLAPSLLSTEPFLKLHVLSPAPDWDQWSATGITESKSFISYRIMCSSENPAVAWILDSRWVCNISCYQPHLLLVKWTYSICNLMKDKRELRSPVIYFWIKAKLK